ncbi:hypothetical protein BSNK01_13930 [Bacillaceae bacterium]
MLVKFLFSSLQERLAQWKAEYANASPQRRKELDAELQTIRQLSGTIIQEWMELEERIEEAEGAKTGQALAPLEVLTTLGHLCSDIEHAFRKGQGYFDLFMYEQAEKQFAAVVEKEPDLEVARLYLAYAHLFADREQEAMGHFQLLAQSSKHPLIVGMAYNGLGCMTARRGNCELALQYFTKALEMFPVLLEAKFNQALVLYQKGDYGEAIRTLDSYLRESEDDWEAVLFLVRLYEASGKEQQAEMLLRQAAQAASEPQILRQVARCLEKHRRYEEAMHCYRQVLQQNRDRAWAWHGLGWNRWLQKGDATGKLWVKKAVILEPDEVDFLFSYGWICLHEEEMECAERTFRFILDKEGEHVLARAGLAELYRMTNRWEEARRCLSPLLEGERAAVRALGYQLLGKLYLHQAKFREAADSFTRSLSESKSFFGGMI